MTQSHRAIIIGGGIAGPALGLFLRRAGVDVRVFEAYPHVENVGGGFQIAPNGMRVLDALGLAEAVAASGCSAGGFTFRNHQGHVIGKMRTDRSGKAVTTLRAPFYRLLLDAAAREGVRIEYRKRLQTLSYDGELVAHFEDGSSARGDFIVGADGVHSRVRALLLPDHAAPRYTGMLGIGGLATHVPTGTSNDALEFIVGPRLSFGYGPMTASGTWGWWCHLPQEKELSSRSVQAIPVETLRARLHETFAGWCDPVGPFLATTQTILRTPLYEVPSLPVWSRGKAVLLGDAAHAMSPAAGQGASLALEDAMVLGHLFAGSDRPIEEVFAEFETRRRRRAESIADVARSNDERSRKQLGSFGCWMRDRMFPLLAPLIARGLEKQYSAPLI